MTSLSPILVVAALVCLVAVVNVQGDILFPFGTMARDTSVSRDDDVFSEVITPPIPVPFFGQSFSSLYVSTNGLISFGEGISGWVPETFPWDTPILAVYWEDVDIRRTGSVTYHPYLRTADNEAVFDRGEAVVRQALGDQCSFTASWMLIATWYQVPAYRSDNETITNSFQVVLLTDGAQSFAIYNYEEIRWAAATGRTGAQVGYNADDDVTYYSVSGSLTDDIVHIDERTNIDTRGRWFFRLFNSIVHGCPDDVILPTRSTNLVPHSWVPPVFSNINCRSVGVVFGCSATSYNHCHQDGYGQFSVGDTEVMYNKTDTSGNQNFCSFTIKVTEVDLVCPLNVTVTTDPGLSTARVNWQEPELTGWNETNFTSTAVSGEPFPIGSQRVTYRQWFGINNLVLTCSFEVDVEDTEPPGINGCPDDVIFPAASTTPVPYTWIPPVFSDNSGQTVDVVFGCFPTDSNECNQDGNGQFSVGDTEVMYNGTDTSENQNFCNFTITVREVDLVCPLKVTFSTDPGSSTARVNWQEPELTGWSETNFTSTAVSGESFPIGSQRVTYQQWFRNNNLVLTCSFEVEVVDSAPSYIYGCSDDVTIPTMLTSPVFHSWVPPVFSDNSGQSVDVVFGCSATVSSECHQDGYGTFSVGETEVMYNGTDTSGNLNFCNFTITVKVVDLVCPLNVTVSTDSGSFSARVNWQEPDLTGWDETNFISTAISGEAFPIGSQRVTYQQWFGINGLVLTCSFEVEVVDNESPGINGCPFDATIPAISTNLVPYTWIPPVFSDNSGQPVGVVFGCSATVSNECYQYGNGHFPVGVTEVMYSGRDTSGNQNFCSFTITVKVVDLVCPTNFLVSADPGFTSTRVNWQEPDLTGWDGTNLTSSAVSGDVFPIGLRSVTYQQWFGMNNLVFECSFAFLVVGQCVPENTEDTVLGSLSWPVTMAGLTAGSIERCPLTTTNAGLPRAVRNCSTAPPPLYFYWADLVPKSCGESEKTVTVEDIVQVDVTEGNAEEVAEFLVNQTSSTSSSSDGDVEAISQVLKNIVNAGSGNPEVTNAVIETVANVIMDAKERQDSPDSRSSSAILQSVEAQVSLTLQQGGNVSIQQDTIHVEAVSIDPKIASNGFSFVSVQQESAGSRSPKEGSLDGTEIKTFTNASEVPQDVVASIQLPANIIYLLPQGNSTTSLQASFIVYADDTLFQTGSIKDSNGTRNLTSKVAGSIVSLSIEGVELQNLTDPVVIDFKILPSVSQEDFDTIKCVFWEFGEESGFWSTEGCELAEMTDDKVSCDCDHATNFAILVNVKGQKRTDEGLSSTPALDIISQIGGALSVVALAITLVIYLSISKLRTGKSRQIFINFCVSLLMLYIVFLAGVDNARGSGGGCVFVGALLHYLTLTTMMWMAVEARNMYVSTVKVFPEETTRYMIKAGLLAWGSPLIVLIVTLAASTMSYQHGHYCFISPGWAMSLGLLTPIGIILLHNVITFILVMRSLLKVKEASRSEQVSKRLQNAVGISALMGLTWSFGFLAIEGASYTFQLLFCLTNSLQGVVVGVMFCARREEVRAAVTPYLRRLCCCRTCQAPKLRSDRSYDLTTSQTGLGTSSIQTASLDISVSAAPEESQGKYVSTEVL